MDAVRLLEELIRFDSANPFVCHEVDLDDPRHLEAGGETRSASRNTWKPLLRSAGSPCGGNRCTKA